MNWFQKQSKSQAAKNKTWASRIFKIFAYKKSQNRLNFTSFSYIQSAWSIRDLHLSKRFKQFIVLSHNPRLFLSVREKRKATLTTEQKQKTTKEI